MIQAKNISFKAGDNNILDSVSVEIESGKVTALLGPNGAGKSSLLKCLTGAVEPTHGEITLAAKRLSDYSLNELAAKRAVLSQANPITFPFTVSEIVMMGRHPYQHCSSLHENQQIITEALKLVDAQHLKDRLFPTLSGGEQQRVQLARILAQLWEQENACLFLDEPTSALDLKHQHLLLRLVSKLAQQQNYAICIIIHDLNLALHYADKGILLKEGKVYDAGAITEILRLNNIMDVFEVDKELAFFYQPYTTTKYAI